MRCTTRIAVFLAAGLAAAQVALARNIDLRLTLEGADDVDNDMDRVYCDVLLSKVVQGPSGPPSRSRYLGPIPQRERALLPESRRGGSKIYTSPTVEGDDEAAVWNDTIVLRNVPDDAKLTVRLWERRSLLPNSWIGDTTVDLKTSGVVAGVGVDMEFEEDIIAGRFFNNDEGDMKIRITNLGQSSADDADVGTFRDGPIKWRRYHSKAVELVTSGLGALISGNKGHYIYLIDLHRSEEAFAGVRASAVESQRIMIEANRPVTGTLLTQEVRLHHGVVNGEEPGNAGEVNDVRGFFDVFDWGRGPKDTGRRFTYIVRDGFLRFTETGAAKTKDFASKHFMLADGNRDVYMAGEMFVLPADKVPASAAADVVRGGAARRHNGPHLTNPPSLPRGEKPVPESTPLPVLVVDNASGTFAPPKERLFNLVELLQYNFQGIDVLPIAFNDKRLEELKLAAKIVA